MIRRRARALATISVLAAMLSVGAVTAAGPATAGGTSSADSVVVVPDNWGWE